MARMSIDDQFLRDPRITRLARRLGHQDPDLTRGKLLHVFALCYDHRSPHVSRDDIETICEGMTDALIDPRIDLALDEPEGIRIRGADDRIDYLRDQSDRGRKGGVESGKSRRGNKNEAYASKQAKHDGTTASKQTKPASSLSTLTSPVPDSPPVVVPAHPQPTSDRTKAGDQIWREHQAARAAVAAELGLEQLPLRTMDNGRKELAERLRECMEQDGETLDEAVARCRHVIARVVNECRRDGTLEWLDGRLWNAGRFDGSVARPVADNGPRRARGSPANTNGNDEPRRVNDL